MEKEEWFKIQKLESKVEKMNNNIIELQKENKELKERFKTHINYECAHNS